MKKILIVLLVLVSFSFNLAQEISKNQILSLKTNLNLDLDEKLNILPSNEFKKKSSGIAILYSLLLPGMGELYADNYSSGQYFTIADAAIWGFLVGFNIYGNSKEDDYRAFAEAYGDVNLENKDEVFFGEIGVYDNVEQFNTEKELNRQFNEVYDVNTHNWNWSNSAQRREYRSLWSSSENAFNNVRFAAGALVLNRIVSAIFAVRAVTKYNNKLNNEVTWNVNFGINQNPAIPSGIVMNFQKSF